MNFIRETEWEHEEEIPHSVEELEEDILETLYQRYQTGEDITEQQLQEKLGVDEQIWNSLIAGLVEQGCIVMQSEQIGVQKEGLPFAITILGRARGRECLKRHEELTSFLQMTCGLEIDEAVKDACRVEHILSSKAIDGVRRFLRSGAVYDRIGKNLDLSLYYEKGKYIFCMSIYCMEQRYPRSLAPEHTWFSDEVLVEINETEHYVYLVPVQDIDIFLWYQNEKRWYLAQKTESGLQLPARIFNYTISADMPIKECECIIGFTKEQAIPEKMQCRELNVHIW